MDKKTLVKKGSEKQRTQYPIGSEHYTLYEEIGQGVSALVYRALCIPLDEIVAIKILDFERDKCDLDRVSREAQIMVLVDHPNVLKSHCSFVCDRDLWVVMPYMAGGSCLHILKAAHPDGFEEVVIATILREVLKGLDYLHNHGYIHRDVKAGNVLIDSHGAIKLGDFGVSAYLFDSGDRQRMRNTFVGTPCWMAPEVMEQLHGYDFKADIWSFGITALELAHGHAPFSKYPPMKVLLMTLQNAPPGLDYERDKKFSKSFRQLIASCLVKDPLKRPSAKKLLKHSFFKQARSNDYISRKLLEGLPALGDRIKALKRKEEDMLAQKKMPDGQKEEISQNEYKRGISSWNFDLEDLKAQASLLPDEEIIGENDQGGSTNALPGPDSQRNQLQSQLSSVELPKFQHQFSFGSQTSDATGFDDNNLSAPPSPIDRNMTSSSSFQEAQISQNSSPCYEEMNSLGRGEQGTHAEVFEGVPVNSCQSCNGAVPQAADDLPAEVLIKPSRASAGSSEDFDEKNKYPYVQQRGRFKVTSENIVDLEKVTPEQLATTQVNLGDSTVDVGCIPSNSAGAEKSLLEAAHDREPDLRRENADLRRENTDLRRENGDIRHENSDLRHENVDLRHENADLRLRLARIEEELQRYKAENKS